MDKSFNLVVGSAALDQGLEFVARSVYIDNPTNQWLRLDSLGVTVPQYTLGATYPLPGTSRAQASFTAPAGQVEPPTIAGQSVKVTFYELSLPISAGVGMLGGRAPYYDRNPLDVQFFGSTTQNANSGSVVIQTYTVPAGRRAYFEAGTVFTQIVAGYANDFARLDTSINVIPSGIPGNGSAITIAEIYGGLAVYTTATGLVGVSLEIQSGDTVTAFSTDLRAAGAGSSYHLASMKLTEFDQ